MSLMNDNTSKNLYEYGKYYKTSLILVLIDILVLFVATFALTGGVLGGILDLEAATVIISVIAIVVAGIMFAFQVLMFLRLANAKNSSPHPFLEKSYMFLLISLIITAITIVISLIQLVILFGLWSTLPILSHLATILGIARSFCSIFNIQFLGRYIAVYSHERAPTQGFMQIEKSVNTYVITSWIIIGVNVLTYIIGLFYTPDPFNPRPFDFLITLIGLASGVCAIIALVAQFKIANRMMEIFGQYVPGGYSNEPTVPLAPSQPTTPASVIDYYCKNCGAKLVAGAKFCTACGSTQE